jgi:hypothetical protein
VVLQVDLFLHQTFYLLRAGICILAIVV